VAGFLMNISFLFFLRLQKYEFLFSSSCPIRLNVTRFWEEVSGDFYTLTGFRNSCSFTLKAFKRPKKLCTNIDPVFILHILIRAIECFYCKTALFSETCHCIGCTLSFTVNNDTGHQVCQTP
jgi:hypothetical protein